MQRSHAFSQSNLFKTQNGSRQMTTRCRIKPCHVLVALECLLFLTVIWSLHKWDQLKHTVLHLSGKPLMILIVVALYLNRARKTHYLHWRKVSTNRPTELYLNLILCSFSHWFQSNWSICVRVFLVRSNLEGAHFLFIQYQMDFFFFSCWYSKWKKHTKHWVSKE